MSDFVAFEVEYFLYKNTSWNVIHTSPLLSKHTPLYFRRKTWVKSRFLLLPGLSSSSSPFSISTLLHRYIRGTEAPLFPLLALHKKVDSPPKHSVPTEVMRDPSPPVVERSREKRSLSISSEESVKTSKTTQKIYRKRSISTDSESEQIKTKKTPKPKRSISDSSDDSLPSRERESQK